MPQGSTQRLRHLRSPSNAEVLARSLLSQTVECPPRGWWINEASELSSQLQKIARNLRKDAGVWTAYATTHSAHLFAAELEFDLSRDRGKPVLRVREYNEQGRVTHSDLWLRVTDEHWTRCSN